jgi:hypothetical protein
MVWPRFSLKKLFLVTTLVAIWLAIGVVRKERERKALFVVAAAGGQYAYTTSYFYPFRQVYIVTFQGNEFTDQKLRDVVPHLERLPGLSFLQIILTSITDDGLQHISGLKRLKTLHLFHNRITDRGLPHLRTLTSLEELDLRATLISDEGLPHIMALTGLRKLRVSGYPPPTGPPTEWSRLADDILGAIPVPGIISDQGVASLKKSMAHCSILSDKKFQFSGDPDDSWKLWQHMIQNGGIKPGYK